jgi:hypothetical protein
MFELSQREGTWGSLYEGRLSEWIETTCNTNLNLYGAINKGPNSCKQKYKRPFSCEFPLDPKWYGDVGQQGERKKFQ